MMRTRRTKRAPTFFLSYRTSPGKSATTPTDQSHLYDRRVSDVFLCFPLRGHGRGARGGGGKAPGIPRGGGGEKRAEVEEEEEDGIVPHLPVPDGAEEGGVARGLQARVLPALPAEMVQAEGHLSRLQGQIQVDFSSGTIFQTVHQAHRSQGRGPTENRRLRHLPGAVASCLQDHPQLHGKFIPDPSMMRGGEGDDDLSFRI